MRCNSKIHVIKDESLGGIKREYIEVDRKAEVGDRAIYIGDHRNVTDVPREVTYSGNAVVTLDGRFHVPVEDVVVLEPTDIVHIDGERFRMVERKAEVGEHILIDTDDVDFDNGSVMTVSDEDRWEDGSGISVNESRNGLYHEEYYVLVPVESESSPQSTEDIIANLVARVAELERFIAGQRSENQLVYDNIEGVKDDIETWSREIETLKHASKETDDRIEMVIDDIVTLDERTQPKKVSIDADTLVKLIGGVRV